MIFFKMKKNLGIYFDILALMYNPNSLHRIDNVIVNIEERQFVHYIKESILHRNKFTFKNEFCEKSKDLHCYLEQFGQCSHKN